MGRHYGQIIFTCYVKFYKAVAIAMKRKASLGCGKETEMVASYRCGYSPCLMKLQPVIYCGAPACSTIYGPSEGGCLYTHSVPTFSIHTECLHCTSVLKVIVASLSFAAMILSGTVSSGSSTCLTLPFCWRKEGSSGDQIEPQTCAYSGCITPVY